MTNPDTTVTTNRPSCRKARQRSSMAATDDAIRLSMPTGAVLFMKHVQTPYALNCFKVSALHIHTVTYFYTYTYT